jgi:putrescine aminotransferase
VAALVIEPVQGEGGVWPLRHDVLRQWVADARAAGCFVLSDEIQSGLGRCGPMSVSVSLGLEPDAVLFGKALGGGIMPVSAMVATTELYAPLMREPFLHTSTFGGHPLGCAAALAGLEVIRSLEDRSQELSRRFAIALAELRRRYPDTVLDVRGQGLLWGIELAPEAVGRALIEISRGGLLFAPCLVQPEVLRLLPPMVTTDSQLDRAVETLDHAFRVAANTA